MVTLTLQCRRVSGIVGEEKERALPSVTVALSTSRAPPSTSRRSVRPFESYWSTKVSFTSPASKIRVYALLAS
jgi:hypothetical protein